MAVTLERQGTRERATTPVIDCDVHPWVASERTLRHYLPARWRRYYDLLGTRGYQGTQYPRATPGAGMRRDAWPPSGLPPGADLPFLREQLLDAWRVEYGILNPLLLAWGVPNVEYMAALARAINDWQLAEWLEAEPRLRASIVVPFEDGDLAAAEIDRLGAHPGFVQVLLTVRSNELLGRRKYWRIYEAAARHDLPVGIHFGVYGGWPVTGAGWPSFYIEDHTDMPQTFQAQVTSLVCEGVFERFPTLRVVLIESGFAWLPPLLWRLDRSWRQLRDEAPDLRRLPSEYVREHCWLTTQPIEEPARPAEFHQLLADLDMNERLMFATDYPHWDFDAPDQVFPAKLAPELARRILADNARAFYRFQRQ